MTLRVECYSGYRDAERPVRFFVGDREFVVEEVLARWYEPDWSCFRVRVRDGKICILRHATAGDNDAWSMEGLPVE